MPHSSLKFRPGIDQNETPALNEAGLSQSQLIRFIPDRNGIGLVQKLGGWTKFSPEYSHAIVRALWAWEDTNAISYLAVGTEDDLSGRSYLSAIPTGDNERDITPTRSTDNVAPNASTTAGLSAVTIVDATTTGITSYDSVYIETHISVGGLILFGLYPCITTSSTSYKIIAVDTLGAPLAAPSTSSTATVASFTTQTTAPAFSVTVTLAHHGYSIGDTYPLLVETVVGGVTLRVSNYTVASVINANSFTINAPDSATSVQTVSINSGNVRFVYNYGVGPAISGTGYGVGYYGQGGYGTGVAVPAGTGTPIPATDWTLDNWGQVLIACPTGTTTTGAQFQPIYEWDPTSNTPTATILPYAPPVNDGIFVAMPQRQIVAWGSTFTGIQDPLLIRWCDVNNYNSWIGTVTNQAGSFRIPKGSRIVGCLQGPQQGLIWTDLGVWSMQYISQPYVYSFNEVGAGCGLIARKAAASINGVVYWMGPSQFFTLSAGGVVPVMCPVWDVIFQDLDTTNLNKIRVAVNSLFGEISWFYPTVSSGGELNAYVKYNINLQAWDFGTLSRSAWIDQSVLGPPIGADPNSLFIYQHETSPNADGQPMLSSFTSGYAAMSDGDLQVFVDQVWPDMKWGYYGGVDSADVEMTFYVTDYPTQTPIAFGPYNLTSTTQFISPRIRGRLVSVKLASSDIDSFWRIGNIRYRVQQDGKY